MAIGPRSIMHFRIPGPTLIIGASGSAYTALSLCTGGTQCVWVDSSGRMGIGSARATAMERCSLTSAIRPSIAAIATAGKGAGVR